MTEQLRVSSPATRPTRRVQPLLREVYGRLLRRRRHDLGRTLADVAAVAGISIAYLSEVERGLKEPSSEILAAVCGALDATVVELVGAAHEELRLLATGTSRQVGRVRPVVQQPIRSVRPTVSLAA